MTESSPHTATESRDACGQCHLRELCMPGGITVDELERLDLLVARRRRVERGATLFREGERFHALYAVHGGSFKTRVTHADGRVQLTGFQLPGELLGLDALAEARHGVDAIALEDSEVCVMPYAELERIARDFAPLQRQLSRVMSREIVRERDVMLMLGGLTAEQRATGFLVGLAERYGRLGYSSRSFVLRMTRAEIGEYLGLKIETVSRAFSKLASDGVIDVDGKRIEILDDAALRGRTGGTGVGRERVLEHRPPIR